MDNPEKLVNIGYILDCLLCFVYTMLTSFSGLSILDCLLCYVYPMLTSFSGLSILDCLFGFVYTMLTSFSGLSILDYLLCLDNPEKLVNIG
jgi:hypothetical protein